MSEYSMPLCTILTKCPAPSGPTWVQHGTPSTCAEISSSSGPSDLYDSAGPPGRIDGPLRGPPAPAEHPPRLPQRTQEFLHGLRPDEFALVAVLFEQRVGLGDRPVVQRDGVAVVGEVAGEVRAHHREAGDAD